MDAITREDRNLIIQLHDEKKRLRKQAVYHREEAKRLQTEINNLSVKKLAEKFETTTGAVLSSIHGEYGGKVMIEKDLN